MTCSTVVTQQGFNGGASNTTSICCSKTYSQTLFLGCSIQSFNASLGWGGEASRLTVELVYDNCAYPSNLRDINDNIIVASMDDNSYTNARKNNTLPKDSNGNSIVPGKVYYLPGGNSLLSKYWLDADPGFYADMPNPADSIDIIGCSVYFKYDDFEFNGIVKSWENTGGSGGTKTYSVTIESPAFLLSQTQMILGDYLGAIFVKGVANNFPNKGFPVITAGNASQYLGDIIEQAIPNVINVYGYLEDATNIFTGFPVGEDGIPYYSYGSSGRNEEGIPARAVLNGMADLLSSIDVVGTQQPKTKILRYSPFGRIIGRAPRYMGNANIIDFSNNLRYRMGLIIPHAFPPSDVPRMGYTIDVLDVFNNGIIPDNYRISSKNISILEFLEKVCSDTGQELFITLDLQIIAGVIYPKIKVTTFSTLYSSIPGAVQSYIDQLTSQQSIVMSYSKGEEFNNTKPVRTMLVGGKQQRLYQIKNTKYADKQSTLRYNPYTDTFMNINHFGFGSFQRYRLPDTTNTRAPGLYAGSANSFAANFGRIPLFPSLTAVSDNFGANIIRGNYHPSISLGGVGIGGQSRSGLEYPSSDADAICPFFGVNDLTGLVRPVTSHYGKTTASGSGGGLGFLIGFSANEIGAAIGKSFAFDSTVRISETEIRAAISGFDAYVGFISGVIQETGGFGLDIWTKILGPILGQNSLRTMLQGINMAYNKYNNSQSGSSTVPMNARSSIMTDPIFFDTMTKLHAYFKKIGDEYYGKQFMVSIPTPQAPARFSWKDSTPLSTNIVIGTTQTGNPIYLSQGSQKTYYAYEPADFAWEEPYNYIDDTLIVGNGEMDLFTKEDGSIEPILGYNNSPQFNYNKYYHQKMFNWLRSMPSAANGSEFWKFDAFRSAGSSAPNNIFWEPSLVIDSSDVLVKPYNVGATDAFNQSIPSNFVSKAYKKGTVDKQYYVHRTQFGRIVPKIVIKTDPVFLNPMNPQAHSVQVAVTEFLAEDYTYNNILSARRAMKVLSVSDKYINSEQYGSGQFSAENAIMGQSKDNKQYNNLSISPKAAMPSFAGIPLLMNVSCYGPWISAPDLIKNDIFAGYDNINGRLENLVGGVNLEVNDDLVPWNYGGMRVLDEAAILMCGQNNDYQAKGETGQLTVVGPPAFSLGSELKGSAWTFRGPTINNIQVQIGESGASTTYTFRTFTRKFTLFNKESADRLKSISQNALKLSRDFRQQSRSILSKILSLGSEPAVSSYDLTGSKLRQYSPMSILVGYSSPYVSPKTNLSPGFYNRPSWSGDSIRQLTTVTLQDARELSQEFEHLFSSKSFMSLDGLLHPVSFYPTLNASTAPYKPYNRIGCPICRGTKSYTFTVRNASTSLFCDFCNETPAGSESTKSKSSKIPPFILSNQADDTILLDPLALENLLTEGVNKKKIDYVNLNPIIMPVGELRNKYAQEGDFSAHHIDVIGRSLVPPAGSLSITDNLAINQNGLEYKDQNALDSDADWNSYAFDSSVGRSPGYFQNNHRFLALRGPLVMSGWGFDTEGYPVPNASGEPKFLNGQGYPLKILNKNDQNGGFANNGYGGTILGKNQQWDVEKGEWSDPKKEDTFYKGWGLRPDTWPVGPIDLRWDETRKVWTTPKSDNQFVNIQLEDNLVPPFPARGFLYCIDKETPLPSGLRRMVFVKDSAQNYGAPRGAKLLCYYDESSGFYEPFNKINIVTSGIIKNTGQASIYNSYAKGFDAETQAIEVPELINVVFNNILNFDIKYNNQPGLFMFDKNQWILINTNAC